MDTNEWHIHRPPGRDEESALRSEEIHKNMECTVSATVDRSQHCQYKNDITMADHNEFSGTTITYLLFLQLLLSKTLYAFSSLNTILKQSGRFDCFGDPDCKCLKHSTLSTVRYRHQCMIPFIWGILVGITVTHLIIQQRVIYINPIPGSNVKAIQSAYDKNVKEDIVNINAKSEFNQQLQPPSTNVTRDETNVKTRLYVGVITAEKFLHSRAQAVNRTWGLQVDRVEFFTQLGREEKYLLPVVNLKRVSDSEYPPQKKAFEMLKYMCEHHIDNFEWFIRADDDVYIRIEKLKGLLSRIDSEKMIYMGQPGHGVPEVREKLGLNGHNFCMGGPGVIFNRKALKALCPRIDQCMDEVVSKEEDVEIGRCVARHLHIECTHAWETLKLFYHSYQEEYTEEKPFSGNLADNEHVKVALTLHHLKVPYIMYRVHRHYSTLLVKSTVQELNQLHGNLEATNFRLPLDQQHRLAVEKSLPKPFKPTKLLEVDAWKSFRTDALYSLNPAHVMRDITNDVLADLKQIGETAIDEAIGHGLPEKYTYSHVIDGYLRSDGVRGTDYLLDVYFSSKSPAKSDEVRRVHLLRPVGDLEVVGIRKSHAEEADPSPFYVVVVAAQPSELDSFMKNFYEPTFLSGGSQSYARLVIVPPTRRKNMLATANATDFSIDKIINFYRLKYSKLQLVASDPVNFQDGDLDTSLQLAFARGISYAHEWAEKEDLRRSTQATVLLTTTNISLSVGLLKTCHLRTGRSTTSDSYSNNFINNERGKKNADKQSPSQVYQPIPFHIYPGVSIDHRPLPMQSQASQSRFGSGPVPLSMIKTEIGFWDEMTTLYEEDNAAAPLCGRLPDLFEVASAALTSFSSMGEKKTFRDVLYGQIYADKLIMLRTPDSAFGKTPQR